MSSLHGGGGGGASDALPSASRANEREAREKSTTPIASLATGVLRASSHEMLVAIADTAPRDAAGSACR
eukprot:4792872-Lingulodinium_polyedra.AAC.1